MKYNTEMTLEQFLYSNYGASHTNQQRNEAIAHFARLSKPKPVFETGATSAAVNELILYTDTTKELAELRDLMYEERATVKPHLSFRPLQFKAMNTYLNEFAGQDVRHIRMNEKQIDEYCQIYANRFADWKREKELQAKQK